MVVVVLIHTNFVRYTTEMTSDKDKLFRHDIFQNHLFIVFLFIQISKVLVDADIGYFGLGPL